jgi:hypothetical protein
MVFGIFIVYKYAEIISNFGYFVNQAIPLSSDNLGEGEERILSQRLRGTKCQLCTPPRSEPHSLCVKIARKAK